MNRFKLTARTGNIRLSAIGAEVTAGGCGNSIVLLVILLFIICISIIPTAESRRR
jgi:hypothetical protein